MSQTAGRVEIRELAHQFVRSRTEETVHALNNMTLSIAPEEFVSLVGPSGCGKTTVLNVIAGFIRPQAGEALLDGRRITGPGADRGVVFQDHALFPWLTARMNVEFGLKLKGLPKLERERISSHYLALVGIAEAGDRHPHELSGGMKQRVALARALANDPKVLLMDEPFAAVDAITRHTLQAELTRIWQEARKTVLFITHDIDEAVLLADRVLVMSPRPGEIVAEEKICLGRPRDKNASDFVEYRRRLGEILEGEPQRSESLVTEEQAEGGVV
jgi:ABC-type nitrate/sulfonate/bicarbonate transport system ATPase subunit